MVRFRSTPRPCSHAGRRPRKKCEEHAHKAGHHHEDSEYFLLCGSGECVGREETHNQTFENDGEPDATGRGRVLVLSAEEGSVHGVASGVRLDCLAEKEALKHPQNGSGSSLSAQKVDG